MPLVKRLSYAMEDVHKRCNNIDKMNLYAKTVVKTEAFRRF